MLEVAGQRQWYLYIYTARLTGHRSPDCPIPQRYILWRWDRATVMLHRGYKRAKLNQCVVNRLHSQVKAYSARSYARTRERAGRNAAFFFEFVVSLSLRGLHEGHDAKEVMGNGPHSQTADTNAARRWHAYRYAAARRGAAPCAAATRFAASRCACQRCARFGIVLVPWRVLGHEVQGGPKRCALAP